MDMNDMKIGDISTETLKKVLAEREKGIDRRKLNQLPNRTITYDGRNIYGSFSLDNVREDMEIAWFHSERLPEGYTIKVVDGRIGGKALRIVKE